MEPITQITATDMPAQRLGPSKRWGCLRAPCRLHTCFDRDAWART
jgi:hypothetical protein